MQSADNSVSAAILTAAYLDKVKAEMDEYMAVYSQFLHRLDNLDRASEKQSAENERQQFDRSYTYRKSTDHSDSDKRIE